MVIYLIVFMIFIYAIHVLCEIFPVFRTLVKYSKNNKYVNYRIFFFKILILEATYSIFEREDILFVKMLHRINSVINLRITIL